MGRVRSRDTQPELLVRRALHRVGLRFRLCPRNLPGRPDIVLPRHKVAIFVHGCFWHQHDCPKGTVPRNNREFWEAKLRRNVERDREKREALEAARRIDPKLREGLTRIDTAHLDDPGLPVEPASAQETEIVPTRRDIWFVYFLGSTRPSLTRSPHQNCSQGARGRQ
jgi:DNA mismatch endonuclease, patch repair protein